MTLLSALLLAPTGGTVTGQFSCLRFGTGHGCFLYYCMYVVMPQPECDKDITRFNCLLHAFIYYINMSFENNSLPCVLYGGGYPFIMPLWFAHFCSYLYTWSYTNHLVTPPLF